MKKLFTFLLIVMSGVAFCQNISLYSGLGPRDSKIIGIEMKGKQLGFYAQKNWFTIIESSKTISAGSSIPTFYRNSGFMTGLSWRLYKKSNFILAAGIGSIYRYNYFVYCDNSVGVEKIQNFAWEFSMGTEIIKSQHLVIGLRAGVNNITSLFGVVSVGYKFKNIYY